MFTTYIMACSLAVSTQCTEFVDVYGPYATEQRCEERAEQMAVDMTEIFNTPHSFYYKCVPSEDLLKT